MMKKLCALFLAVLMAVPLSGCVGEFLLVMTVAEAITSYGDEYGLRANWGIELPEEYEELYAFMEYGKDGDRYHVLRYKDSTGLDDHFVWTRQSGKTRYCDSYLEFAKEVIDKLQVPEEYHPDFEQCVWYYQRAIDGDTRDEILMLRNGDMLYIVQGFY